jgi:hypothetical protein
VRLQLKGDERVRAELRRLGKLWPAGMGAAVYRLGVAILSDALPRTPVELGVLRTSGYVSPPSGEGARATVEVGFGTVYAVPQHERTDYHHPRGGGPKYLARAIEAVAPRALPLLAKWVREFRGGWGQVAGIPTRPTVGNSTPKKTPQRRRLARAARNVRRRTGR